MSALDLFNTTRVRVNGKCEIVDMRESQQPESGTLCSYYRGKPLDKNSLCARPGCGRPWSEHYPPYQPKRVRGSIAEVCSVCGMPTDSEAHLKHCGG
jgi:hypothetical protein